MMVNNGEEALFDVPISLIVYKRLEKTKRVMEVIKQIKPEKLFIISDGAKNQKDLKQVEEVRTFLDGAVDWKCEIYKNYSEMNLGCARRVVSGLDWVFSMVDRTIVLEDDILPNYSFFEYCSRLLKRFQDTPDVMMISGYNDYGILPIEDSYIFHSVANIWGWATWKRAWKLMDFEMNEWPIIKRNKVLYKRFSKKIAAYLTGTFDRAYYGEVDSWGYRWNYSLVKNYGYCVVPKYNMVTNIGIGDPDATHTKGGKRIIKGMEDNGIWKDPEEIKPNMILLSYEEEMGMRCNVVRERMKASLPRALVNVVKGIHSI